MNNKEILSQLTLLEKAAMISGKTVWESRDIPRLGIPSIFFADGPSGVRKQAGASDHLGQNPSIEATCFPSSATLANSWNEEVVYQVGEAIGEEASFQNVDVILGPGLNIKRSPLCGRNFEYYSEDPHLAGKMASAFIRGVQSKNVATTPKHFAVNSQELRRMTSDSIIDERTLQEIYLTAFEIVVKEANPKGMMSSYNLINGTYANENPHLLEGILRERWGFDGFVVTDWGGSNDIVEGIKAGSTLEMPDAGLDSARQVMAAVKEGRLAEADLDARVLELLDLINYKARRVAPSDIHFAAHHEVARKAAEESVVLLKNQEDILPLLDTQKKVAIIGEMAENPRYQGAGSSLINTNQLESIMGCVKDTELKVVGYEKGYGLTHSTDSEQASALELAKKAEIILLFLGLTPQDETEGLDRQHLQLPDAQINLLKALYKVNPNIIVVLSGGAPIVLPWENYAKGILHGYLGGEAGASAMLNVITGKVNPSGKLNETYPLTLESTPPSRDFPAKGRDAQYRESIFVGYRYYNTANVPVQYPFGYGKSYTSFAYSNLTVTHQGVSFQITNTGSVAGAEIAQLYVGLKNSGLFRASEELKGFVKVYLEPAQSKMVEIPFDERTFRFFNAKSGQWEIESGEYTISIGENARSFLLTDSLEVVGNATDFEYTKEELPTYYTGQVSKISKEEYEKLLGRKLTPPVNDKILRRNDTLGQMKDAKSGAARMIGRFMERTVEKSEQKGAPDLNAIFRYNMPFRAIAKMTNGMISMKMVDGLLILVNGRFFAGAKQFIGGYFSNKKANKETQQELDRIR